MYILSAITWAVTTSDFHFMTFLVKRIHDNEKHWKKYYNSSSSLILVNELLSDLRGAGYFKQCYPKFIININISLAYI